MEGCDMYQRMKNRMEVPVGKLKLSEVLEKPWTHIVMRCLNTNNFYFILFYFSDFTFLFFYFFYFIWKDDEEGT